MSFKIFAIAFLLTGSMIYAQSPDSLDNYFSNTADNMMLGDKKLQIGGYGEVHYNQPLFTDEFEAGTLDVHRIVTFLGYNFSKRTHFITEIEVEYAKELWIEQAFLQHKINKYVNFRAGLLLVPMGIINEYHEPTVFNGVERPAIDNRISLSTWREVGTGFSGAVLPLSLKYQCYVVSGLNGYNTKAVFSGSKGLRDGRQKGSKAYVFSPAFAGKIEYFGIKNLNIGFSAYTGESQSKLYAGIDKDSLLLSVVADSSTVSISMFGVDFRYRIKGFEVRGQYYLSNHENTDQYNVFTQTHEVNNDLGKKMLGYYFEAGYNVLRLVRNTKLELIPFIRYEYYDLHHAVSNEITRNDAYQNTVITSGLTFKLRTNAVLKTDIQFLRAANADIWTKIFNAGIGVMF